MKKVVINNCFGGFSLSNAATKRITELNGMECYFFKLDYSNGYGKDCRYVGIDVDDTSQFNMAFNIKNPNDFDMNVNKNYEKYCCCYSDISRDDPLLLQVIDEIGLEKSSGMCAKLKIVEIPDDIEYCIDEYDGMESIHEQHRSWG